MKDILVIVNVLESQRKNYRPIFMNMEDYVRDYGNGYDNKVLVVRNMNVVPMFKKSYLTGATFYNTLSDDDFIVDYDDFKVAEYFADKDHLVFIGDNHHHMIDRLAKQCHAAGVGCSAIPDCNYGPRLQ